MTNSNHNTDYDVIIVGARCAGSPTAMLLARAGYKVLLVDRARFPSDTVSTHLIHPPGVAALDRWGLLNRLVATGCPPITTYSFEFGPVTISGNPLSSSSGDGRGQRPGTAYCPRRTVLDALLVDAAREAGAEVREGFILDELLVEGGSVVGIRGHARGASPVAERARVVVGADGAHSRVAKEVGAATYNEHPVLAAAYFSYWSGFPVDGAQWVIRPGQAFGALPTNDGLTMVLTAWPRSEFKRVKKDIEGSYLGAMRFAFGDRIDAAHREERVVGGGVPNFFRKPFGPGWTLVGDAGYLKDPVTAQGITDAFLDAELCVAALESTFEGRQPFDAAMVDYQQRRDARVLPIYEFTQQLGSLEPPPPEFGELLGAVAGDRQAMDQFASVVAGTVSPIEFFDPANIQRLMTGAEAHSWRSCREPGHGTERDAACRDATPKDAP